MLLLDPSALLHGGDSIIVWSEARVERYEMNAIVMYIASAINRNPTNIHRISLSRMFFNPSASLKLDAPFDLFSVFFFAIIALLFSIFVQK